VLDQVLFLLGIAGRQLEHARRGAAQDVVLQSCKTLSSKIN
jgi:hypothetical protein